MNNKILIKLCVPYCDKYFDFLIPVNELVWKTSNLIARLVNEISNIDYDENSKYILVNMLTNEIYPSNISIYDTNIRNATELLLIKVK